MDEAFERERPRLRAIAYRMLGSVAAAEDILQDAWLRWHDAEGAESAPAYLTAIVTRLCLDQLKSARVRRETYVGPWLPEPLRTGEDEIDRESISLAFLVLLERLAPIERAVFLLHQVFDYSHAEVARLVGKDDATVRQILHRARERVATERPRFAQSREEHAQLLGAFLAACAEGNLGALESLLAENAIARSDSGGQVRAARNEVVGASRVAKLLVGIARRGPTEGWQVELAEINGWPAALLRHNQVVEHVVTIETDGHRIHAVGIVSNPEKLGRL